MLFVLVSEVAKVPVLEEPMISSLIESTTERVREEVVAKVLLGLKVNRDISDDTIIVISVTATLSNARDG